MWKKIHSNRDPKDTLYSELRKEFSAGFAKTEGLARSAFTRYPKLIFRGMVAALLVSMVLTMTVFRPHEKSVGAVPKKKENPAPDGISQLLHVTTKIRETIALKSLVDSLSAKKTLSPADSIGLDTALSRLQRISVRP